MDKQVTEKDFRMPELRDAKVEDYEFRDDGVLARKDRWEQGIRSIATILFGGRKKYEISQVVDAVRKLAVKPITTCQADGDGECVHEQCPQLRDGEPHKTNRHCPLDKTPEDV